MLLQAVMPDQLDLAIDAALDALLAALALEPLGDDRFRGANEPMRFARTFGGQLLGQTLMAASATATSRRIATTSSTLSDSFVFK